MKNKTLVIVQKQENLDKILPFIKKNNLKNITIFSLIGKVDINATIKTLENYETVSRRVLDADKNALKWLKDWPSKKILNGKNFKEIVAYEMTSLWWFVDGWMYRISMPPFYSMREIIKSVEIIIGVVKEEKPSRIIVVDDETSVAKAVHIISKLKKIRLTTIKPNIKDAIKRKLEKVFVPFLIWNFRKTKGIIRKTYWKITSLKKSKISGNKKKVILLSTVTTNWQTMTNLETGRPERNDLMLGSIVRELEKSRNNKIVVVEFDISRKIGIMNLFEKKKYFKPIEAYLTADIERKVKKWKGQLNNKWEFLKNNIKFKQSLSYNGFPLWDLMEPLLRELFHRKLVEGVKYIELMKNTLEIEKANIVVSVDEAGPNGRAMVLVAKIKKIPSLAIQHGAFGPLEIGHIHRAEDIPKNDELDPNHTILSDMTTVYGRYDRGLFVNIGSYPSNKVVIMGQPRYDIFARANKVFKREETCKKLGLNPKKKIIVMTSQPLPKEENEVIFTAIFKSMKELTNMQLVIKLHREDYYESMYKKTASGLGVRDFVMVKNIDICEVLNLADIMMTAFSTTALEAMILGKPVITINLTRKKDINPYAKSGAAIGVYRDEDLVPAVQKILNNKKTREKLRRNMKNFVNYYIYKVDGFASKRIVNLIGKMVGG